MIKAPIVAKEPTDPQGLELKFNRALQVLARVPVCFRLKETSHPRVEKSPHSPLCVQLGSNLDPKQKTQAIVIQDPCTAPMNI